MEKYERKKAWEIGSVCIGTYIISYCVRNLLGVLSPYMLAEGAYDEKALALFSSAYMMVYAMGQLVNGFIGDKIKGKYMTAIGLLVSAAGIFLFGISSGTAVGILAFGIVGFGLSMLRGPLVKIISENTAPGYARVCCAFLSFASCAGPLIAGLAAVVFHWNTVFWIAGAVLTVVAVWSFVLLSVLEQKGMIRPPERKTVQKAEKGDLLALFRLENFIPYMVIGMAIEISSSSINFWMPTFFHKYLSLSEDTSNMMFSLISLLRSVCPFLGITVYKLCKENDIMIIRVTFLIAAVFCLLIPLIPCVGIALVFFALALMCSGIATAIMWSVYIPGLGKSGRVSGANGVLDCSGYLATAVANVSIVPIINGVGWNGVIFFWAAIMALGAVAALFGKTKKKAETE